MSNMVGTTHQILPTHATFSGPRHCSRSEQCQTVFVGNLIQPETELDPCRISPQGS